MPLRLEITSFQRDRLGERRMKEFGVNGGTIGRSLESDWSLEDSNRYLSGRHAAIDFRSGSYYIIDTSTNGVFVNESETPIGRTKPQRLFHGDRLRLGEYIMRVHLDDGDLDDDLQSDSHSDPVDTALRTSPAEPSEYTLVSEEELGVLAIEEILADATAADALKAAAEAAASSLRLVDEVTQPPPKPAPKASTGPAPAPEKAAAAKTEQARRQRATNAKGKRTSSAAKKTRQQEDKQRDSRQMVSVETTDEQTGVFAFLRGAGIPLREMDSSEASILLHRAGQLVRELAIGLRKTIQLRIDQKNLMRLANTTIQPQNNNLLKFAASLDEALENLFFMKKAEYLPAVEAVREAFDEISAHERAVLEATHAALLDYLERIAPEEIEQKCGDSKRGLLGPKAEAKYWQRYAELYLTLAEHAPGQFPQMFAEVFAAAYDRESAKQMGANAKRPARSETA